MSMMLLLTLVMYAYSTDTLCLHQASSRSVSPGFILQACTFIIPLFTFPAHFVRICINFITLLIYMASYFVDLLTDALASDTLRTWSQHHHIGVLIIIALTFMVLTSFILRCSVRWTRALIDSRRFAPRTVGFLHGFCCRSIRRRLHFDYVKRGKQLARRPQPIYIPSITSTPHHDAYNMMFSSTAAAHTDLVLNQPASSSSAVPANVIRTPPPPMYAPERISPVRSHRQPSNLAAPAACSADGLRVVVPNADVPPMYQPIICKGPCANSIGYETLAMVDTGATHSFITPEFAQTLGCTIVELGSTTKLADGSIVASQIGRAHV